MKEKLTTKEIEYLASLSRLGLKADEIAKYQVEISKILDYFGELTALDTSQAESYRGITAANKTREDVILIPEASPAELLKSAPAKENNFIKVKSVFQR